MEIKTAGVENLDDIMKVEAFCFHKDIQEDREVFKKRILVYSEGFKCLWEECSISGYFCSELWENCDIFDENLFTLGHDVSERFCENGKWLYISSFGVIKRNDEKGKGSFLFRESVKSILQNNSNITDIVLLVNEKWAGARHIYKKCGFEEKHIIKSFFKYSNQSADDGIIMTCKRTTLLENIK